MSLAGNLTQNNQLPIFSKIKPQDIEADLNQLLTQNRNNIKALLQSIEQADNAENILATTFLQAMEQWDDELERFWSPISHLHGVLNTDELRTSYNQCLPKLTEYATEIGQNEELYNAYKKLANSNQFSQLSIGQKKAIENTLRDFTLSGIALDKNKQQRFGDIKKRLAQLSTEFSNNVLDATHGWYKHVTDKSILKGIPETTLQNYQLAAKSKELEGYVISLDVPAYLPVMQYADNADLREEMYRAYTTRASEQGPNAGEWDNSERMKEILSLRHEKAQLLGFANYSENSLETKMADSPKQVLEFLNDLVEKSSTVATKEYQELEEFAKKFSSDPLRASDVVYYSEKLRVEKYSISQEELRPYFPADKVISGMFEVVNRLFGIDIDEVINFDSWHSDVRFFNISKDGNIVAEFYLDIFARENKRGGAWMADCQVRRLLPSGHTQLPVAFLTCNFTPASSELPSLLTHTEVTTLFHEFGHGLHHMLTTIDCAAVSGINGVPWDAVELPSQFLENWCWEKESIALISEHYQTGEVLPSHMLEKMLAAKNFQSGMQMMRQLEFALFDMTMHSNYDSSNPVNIQSLLDSVRKKVAVFSVPEYNRFQHSFSHIFAGGYAAGYYSYKWAEVLSADAFSCFEEEGIFNKATGDRFLQSILQNGGSEDPMTLFTRFRFREPNTDALLRHSGITLEDIA